jgi:hypothetical protein
MTLKIDTRDSLLEGCLAGKEDYITEKQLFSKVLGEQTTINIF